MSNGDGAPLKTALVTGGGVRIGQAVSVDLARRGYRVAIHYFSSDAGAKETLAQIEAAGGEGCLLRGDLSRAEDCAQVVEEASETLGGLDLLVNNAAVFENDLITDFTVESWDWHNHINLRAPAILTQGFARQLPKGANGNIINIIDMRVWRLTPYFSSYTIAKAGLWALTQTTAMALAPKIRVNAIGPGPVLPSDRQTQEEFDEQCRKTPLGRGAPPEDICEAVGYILKARAMTGQMIALDGGQHLPWSQHTDLSKE